MARVYLILGLLFGLLLPVTSSAKVGHGCPALLAARVAAPPKLHTGKAELRELAPGVFHLVFATQEEVASTFLRFQEHYESPEFRGKIFTLDEYKAWYIRTMGGFTYYQDWAGFNFPSRVLEPFYEGKFDPLTEKEKSLLELFRPYRGTRFYIIATFDGAGELGTVHHETAHAFYYMNDAYHREVDEVLATLDQGPIHDWFRRSAGYHESVFQDETHAYLINGVESLARAGIDLSPYRVAIDRLHEIFNRHFDSLPVTILAR